MVADFEEGPLSFMNNLRTSQPIGDDGLRLILILGNVFGNLRDEETFVRKKLWKMIRKGDLVWLEVGLRPADISSDPLYTLTLPNRAESASEANRRLLLEGPYRRYAAAIGRKSPSVTTRVWLREDDDSARIPGSVNFCHDLHIEEEGRVVTMLYSRRYELDAFSQWCERMGFSVLGYKRVSDSHGSPRVAHLLLQRN